MKPFNYRKITPQLKFHLIFFPLFIPMYNETSEWQNSETEVLPMSVRLYECFYVLEYRNLYLEKSLSLQNKNSATVEA